MIENATAISVAEAEAPPLTKERFDDGRMWEWPPGYFLCQYAGGAIAHSGGVVVFGAPR